MIDIQDEKVCPDPENGTDNRADDPVKETDTKAQDTQTADEASETEAGTDAAADTAEEEKAADTAKEEAEPEETGSEAGETVEDCGGIEKPEIETGDENVGDGDDVMDGQWESTQDEGGIRNFFKKKEKKDKRDQQIEELTDRVRRQMAEFDNFRKRTEKEKAASFEIGARSVIEKILPVVDNFERGLESGGDSTDPFVEGMNRIYRQLMTTLEAMDVKPIEAVGQPFNPDLHNAVMHVDDDSLGENVVAEELQKGYTYRGTVVRYSMVKVAN